MLLPLAVVVVMIALPNHLFASGGFQCVQAGTVNYNVSPTSVSDTGTSMTATFNFASTQVGQDPTCDGAQSVSITFFFKGSSGNLLGQQVWSGPTIPSDPVTGMNQNVSYGNTYTFTLGTFNQTQASLGSGATFSSYVQVTDANSGSQITQSSPVAITYGSGGTPPISPSSPVTSSSSIALTNPLGSSCNDLTCPLAAVMNFIFTISIPICGIIILIGGFQMMTAGGNPEKFSTGKKTILYAVIGFVVVLLAGGVAKLIQSILGGGSS